MLLNHPWELFVSSGERQKRLLGSAKCASSACPKPGSQPLNPLSHAFLCPAHTGKLSKLSPLKSGQLPDLLSGKPKQALPFLFQYNQSPFLAITASSHMEQELEQRGSMREKGSLDKELPCLGQESSTTRQWNKELGLEVKVSNASIS